MTTIHASDTGGDRRTPSAAPRPVPAPRRGRCNRPAILFALLGALLGALATPARGQDTSLEEFDAVDPYTKGQPELMQRLGVVSFGPFAWAGTHRTPDVQDALGGIPLILIETEHFRLASTLESHKFGDDREEKEWLARELAEFKKRLPKFKPSTKLDPWLRAHLWAQRLEAQYADFTKSFGVTPEDFTDLERRAKRGEPMGVGPYLGQKNKFTVLLTEKRSALGRYLKRFTGLEAEYSYRYKFEDTYFFGANFEALQDNERGFESAFAAGVAAAVTANFIDGFRDSNNVAPDWLRYGLAHVYARRIDARWNQWGAGGDPTTSDDTGWIWAPRVHGLVKNNAALPWAEMLGWTKLEDIKPRDHMIAWSRVEWLLEAKKDEARALLFALTKPIDDWGPKREELRVEQQVRAFRDVFAADAAELDQQWRAWVLKTYAKKR